MKAHLLENGDLVLTSESSLEAFALQKWLSDKNIKKTNIKLEIGSTHEERLKTMEGFHQLITEHSKEFGEFLKSKGQELPKDIIGKLGSELTKEMLNQI